MPVTFSRFQWTNPEMFRLGLAGRLILIVLFGMLALLALLGAIQWLARNAQTPDLAERRLPGQVTDLVAFYEQVPLDLRNKAFEIADPMLHITILKRLPPEEDGSIDLPTVRVAIENALASSGQRAKIVSVKTSVSPDRMFPRLRAWLSPQQDFEVLVRLTGGEVLSVRGRAQLGEKVFGTPPGFWLGLIGFLIGALTLVGIVREARPLRQLSEAMARFSNSAKPQLLPQSTAPDTAALINAFDVMQNRVSSLVASRALVIGAVSHDLRTFMTRLRFRVEAMEDQDQRNRAIADLDDMQNALSQALDFARGISDGAKREELNFSDLVQREIEASRAHGQAIDDVRLAPNVMLNGDRIALRRVIVNLIDNAVKYGGSASIALQISGESIVLAVDDKGPGIEETRRAEVFEPFFRLDEARSNPSRGSGLGLAIARQIVESHKGSISVGDAPHGGARFVVRLPRGLNRH
jgi:two-component system, OmpR family, osmolarity sensor histidine kinase EnvZ